MLHSSILTSRLSNSFVRSVTSTHTVSLSTVAKKKPVISSWPHEHEGNEISVNWSLTIDGIVPVGDAFRNARTALLTTRLPAKVSGGKVDIARPNYTGAYKVEEADDSSTVTHAIFEDWKAASDAHFSSGADLFIEDSGLGAHAGVRIGTRIITDIPAAAVIARTLMVCARLLYTYVYIIIYNVTNMITYIIPYHLSKCKRFKHQHEQWIIGRDSTDGI